MDLKRIYIESTGDGQKFGVLQFYRNITVYYLNIVDVKISKVLL